jgi:Ca2+-binding RTX toxin-like protein
MLTGLGGNDRLVGGSDSDTLTGGPGADRFVFTALTDSPVSTPDIITDFLHGTDVFDLSAVDANSSIKKDQAFAFFAGEDSNVIANSVTWYESPGGDTIVQADVDGNTTADMMWVLLGTNHNLTASDFIL